MKTKLHFYAALTGLRGIGALWVTIFHLFGTTGNSAINAGYLGVDLFFLLSGFIISHVHAKDFIDGYGIGKHLHFLQLRLARIYPLHVAILVLFAVFVMTAPGFVERYSSAEKLGLRAFVETLLLVHNWGFDIANLWNGPTWSLSAEWLAYLVFPFISLVTARVSARRALLAAFLALAVMEAILFVAGNRETMGRVGLVRIAFEFTAGCFIQRYVRDSSKNRLDAAAWPAFIFILVGVNVPQANMFATPGFALLIMAAASGHNRLTAWLRSRPVMHLGNASFSLYMCHWPLIQIQNWAIARGLVSHKLGLAILLPSIFVATYLCWKYVEVPAQALGKRLIARGVRTSSGDPTAKQHTLSES